MSTPSDPRCTCGHRQSAHRMALKGHRIFYPCPELVEHPTEPHTTTPCPCRDFREAPHG